MNNNSSIITKRGEEGEKNSKLKQTKGKNKHFGKPKLRTDGIEPPKVLTNEFTAHLPYQMRIIPKGGNK